MNEKKILESNKINNPDEFRFTGKTLHSYHQSKFWQGYYTLVLDSVKIIRTSEGVVEKASFKSLSTSLMMEVKELTLTSESDKGIISLCCTIKNEGTYMDEDNGFFERKTKLDISFCIKCSSEEKADKLLSWLLQNKEYGVKRFPKEPILVVGNFSIDRVSKLLSNNSEMLSNELLNVFRDISMNPVVKINTVNNSERISFNYQ